MKPILSRVYTLTADVPVSVVVGEALIRGFVGTWMGGPPGTIG